MVGAKQLFDAVPAETLTDFAQFPPPAVFGLAMRTAMRQIGRGADAGNLVISNVPGPRQPLYSAGAKLLHYYPVSTIIDGQGLNVTVQSYLDTLDFGLVSCRELVPDLWDMLDLIVDDLEGLAKLTGARATCPRLEPESESDHPIPHEARCDSLSQGQGLGIHAHQVPTTW